MIIIARRMFFFSPCKRTSSNKNRVPFLGSTFASTLTISFKENLSLKGKKKNAESGMGFCLLQPSNWVTLQSCNILIILTFRFSPFDLYKCVHVCRYSFQSLLKNIKQPNYFSFLGLIANKAKFGFVRFQENHTGGQKKKKLGKWSRGKIPLPFVPSLILLSRFSTWTFWASVENRGHINPFYQLSNDS